MTNQAGGAKRLGRPLGILLIFVGIGVALIMVMSVSSRFFYFFEQVNQDEVGVQFESGRIKNIVGPGVYNDAGLFVDLQRISSKAVPFEVEDEELITKDKQRIGLMVTGDIFRPNLAEADQLRNAVAPSTTSSFVIDEAARTQVIARATPGDEGLCGRPQLRRRRDRHRARCAARLHLQRIGQAVRAILG